MIYDLKYLEFVVQTYIYLMKILTISLAFLLLVLVLSDNCNPYGVRLNYGQAFATRKQSKEKLGLRFNTKDECAGLSLKINFGTVVHCELLEKTDFPLDPHEAKNNGIENPEPYRTHIHKCSISSQIKWSQPFSYSIVNEKGNALFEESRVSVRDPHNQSQLKVLHVADWGNVGKYIKTRKPIIDTLVELVNQQNVQAVILNGDIGYEINTNGPHHQEFLQTLQRISRKVPIIVNRGNHEYNQASEWFQHYYQSYGLFEKKAAGLQVGPVFFGMYDPYAAIMPDFYDRYTITERFSSYFGFQEVLRNAATLDKTIIALSHYPIICGYPTSKFCLPNEETGQILPFYANLGRYYNQMIKYQIPLILSGHVHTYERSYPMLEGYKIYNKNLTQYNYNQKRFFVQVVDGSAGSMHKDLYMDYKGEGKVEKEVLTYLANHLEGKTGFGLVTIKDDSIRYQHYALSVDAPNQITDDFTINIVNKVHHKSEDQELDDHEDQLRDTFNSYGQSRNQKASKQNEDL